MPSIDVILSPALVSFYQLGVRLQQVRMLHSSATGEVKHTAAVEPWHVSGAINLLLLAAEQLFATAQSGARESRVVFLARKAEAEWERWVRAEGYDLNGMTFQQTLTDLETVTLQMAGSLGDQRQQAQDWFLLGQVIAGIVQIPMRFAHPARKGQKPDLVPVQHPEPGECVWVCARLEQLQELLSRLEVDLAYLFPEQCEEEDRLPLLRLPWEFQSWHHVESGLRRLHRGAVPARLQDERSEARDRWIYELCQQNVAYDTIASRLRREHPEWRKITSKQGILQAAQRYAEKHCLNPPPRRQDL
jgi:hypothetical protein